MTDTILEITPHQTLGKTPFARSRQLYLRIQTKEITLGGNRLLKTYGTLDCTSGKRMKLGKRVFFRDEAGALQAGYRPCAHCMRTQYKAWKNSDFRVEKFNGDEWF